MPDANASDNERSYYQTRGRKSFAIILSLAFENLQRFFLVSGPIC